MPAMRDNQQAPAGSRYQQLREDQIDRTPATEHPLPPLTNVLFHGDDPTTKQDDCFRFVGHNSGNQSTQADDTLKNDALTTSIISSMTDALAIQEHGQHTPFITKQVQLIPALVESLKSEQQHIKGIVSYNKHSGISSRRLWGGTAVLSTNKLARYAAGSGSDPTGLGRWSWARFKGKGQITFLIARR
jgi:hypothetical protein